MRGKLPILLVIFGTLALSFAQQPAPAEPPSAPATEGSPAAQLPGSPTSAAPSISEPSAPSVQVPGLRVGDKLDIRELIQRAVDNHKKNLSVIRNYVYEERTVEDDLNKDGSVKKTEIKTYEVTTVFGKPYERLVAKNDRPLSDDDAAKEEKKYQRHYDEAKKKAESGKDEAKQEKEERELADALVGMMNFTLVGEDTVEQRPVYIVAAEPNPQRKPKSRVENIISKIRGKIWIDKNDYEWVRVDADLLDDFSMGLFLFKLNKGARVEFERTRVNDEVWLPRRVAVQGSGRVLMIRGRTHEETTFSKYRRFKGDARLIGVAEGPPPPVTATPPPPQ